ncbi:hypothetical protein DPMN_023053 [Dreissena polymorpha]|uniref:Uncharacterized protein n=1 Tax=Dreissena polymorpha TaxID=45954 RepID=A0A9D4RB13_DREPO|nr:hypothetical protein DPMN_023053 [Dreissena polymorpha]
MSTKARQSNHLFGTSERTRVKGRKNRGNSFTRQECYTEGDTRSKVGAGETKR